MKKFIVLLTLSVLVMSTASGCRLFGNRNGDCCDSCASSCGSGMLQGIPAIQGLPAGPINSNRLEVLPSP